MRNPGKANAFPGFSCAGFPPDMFRSDSFCVGSSSTQVPGTSCPGYTLRPGYSAMSVPVSLVPHMGSFRISLYRISFYSGYFLFWICFVPIILLCRILSCRISFVPDIFVPHSLNAGELLLPEFQHAAARCVGRDIQRVRPVGRNADVAVRIERIEIPCVEVCR